MRILRVRKRIKIYLCEDYEMIMLRWTRCSFPEELFKLFEKAYGLQEAVSMCKALNTRAPLTIRTNTLRTTREHLLHSLLK